MALHSLGATDRPGPRRLLVDRRDRRLRALDLPTVPRLRGILAGREQDAVVGSERLSVLVEQADGRDAHEAAQVDVDEAAIAAVRHGHLHAADGEKRFPVAPQLQVQRVGARRDRAPLQLIAPRVANPWMGGEAVATAFARALPRMIAIWQSRERPFIATVTAQGKVTIVEGGQRRGAIRRP